MIQEKCWQTGVAAAMNWTREGADLICIEKGEGGMPLEDYWSTQLPGEALEPLFLGPAEKRS